MSKLILILVAISNLTGGIEIASDFDVDIAAGMNLALETDAADTTLDAGHAEEEECEHCAHASSHLLGCIAIELATQPELQAHQLADRADHFRSQHFRPAIPPNIPTSA